MTATEVVAALERLQSNAELDKVRKRLRPDDEAIGVRMRALFDTAKAHQEMELEEVSRLLDHPTYEARMAAFCILDFKARRRLDDRQRRELHDLYLARHERITTWDMVDRAAPRVVGGYLLGRPLAPLSELARSDAPLERRTAITAPLYFAKAGTEDDIAGGFSIAAVLAADPDPVVHNAVGIFLKHAGKRAPSMLQRFLADHADSMPRAAVRVATQNLRSSRH